MRSHQALSAKTNTSSTPSLVCNSNREHLTYRESDSSLDNNVNKEKTTESNAKDVEGSSLTRLTNYDHDFKNLKIFPGKQENRIYGQNDNTFSNPQKTSPGIGWPKISQPGQALNNLQHKPTLQPNTTVVNTRSNRDELSTRGDLEGSNEDEVATDNPTPAPAPGVSPPPPPPPGVPTGQCLVTSGPTYSPTGTIPVTTSGNRKRAPFSFAAAFGTQFVTLPMTVPSCCEVHQYIKWDQAFQTWKGGPPHSGFSSSASAGTWYEDRDANDKRYGHRSGPYSDPIANGGDEYTTAGVQDQANGDTYAGRDSPYGPLSMAGKFDFFLKVVDACNHDSEKTRSGVITVNW